MDSRAKAPFPTTSWRCIRDACDQTSNDADRALNRLCQDYWRPVYSFIRSHGLLPEEAADRTQEFFADFLERRSFASADPDRGRFRTFLRTAVFRFLANAWDREKTWKRGGRQIIVSLDVVMAEETQTLLISKESNPSESYDRSWALCLIEAARAKTESEYCDAGKKEIFQALSPLLMERQSDVTRAELAQRQGVSVGAIDVAIHRIRQRFRSVLRELVLQTVEHEDLVDDELRQLIAILGG